MSIQEQVSLSGLAFSDADQSSRQWKSVDWPDLLGGWRWNHASVVLDDPYDRENQQIIVVLGGDMQDEENNSGTPTDTVILLHSNGAESGNSPMWYEGPIMRSARASHAAVVCNGYVYAIGGRKYHGLDLNIMDRIRVLDLLENQHQENP